MAVKEGPCVPDTEGSQREETEEEEAVAEEEEEEDSCAKAAQEVLGARLARKTENRGGACGGDREEGKTSTDGWGRGEGEGDGGGKGEGEAQDWKDGMLGVRWERWEQVAAHASGV